MQRSIFDEIQGVWIADETLFRVFDISSQSEQKLRSKRRSKIVKICAYLLRPGARFSKAPESFRARKTIFKSSVSKNGEVYTLEPSCMKGTSLHL